VSDFGAKIIHKIEPSGHESKVTKFIDVPYEPKGLSITPDGYLLVAGNPNKLAEYDAKTGEKKCEVDLTTLFQMPEACAAYDVNPLHAIKRADGEYVVCHGSGVRIMKADGYTRRCYGGMWGPSEKDQLNNACHVALREDNHVIVADNNNNRLVLLDGSLEYVRTIVEFQQPHRVWFDAQSRLLYVGESTDNGCVKVFETQK